MHPALQLRQGMVLFADKVTVQHSLLNYLAVEVSEKQFFVFVHRSRILSALASQRIKGCDAKH